MVSGVSIGASGGKTSGDQLEYMSSTREAKESGRSDNGVDAIGGYENETRDLFYVSEKGPVNLSQEDVEAFAAALEENGYNSHATFFYNPHQNPDAVSIGLMAMSIIQAEKEALTDAGIDNNFEAAFAVHQQPNGDNTHIHVHFAAQNPETAAFLENHHTDRDWQIKINEIEDVYLVPDAAELERRQEAELRSISQLSPTERIDSALMKAEGNVEAARELFSDQDRFNGRVNTLTKQGVLDGNGFNVDKYIEQNMQIAKAIVDAGTAFEDKTNELTESMQVAIAASDTTITAETLKANVESVWNVDDRTAPAIDNTVKDEAGFFAASEKGESYEPTTSDGYQKLSRYAEDGVATKIVDNSYSETFKATDLDKAKEYALSDANARHTGSLAETTVERSTQETLSNVYGQDANRTKEDVVRDGQAAWTAKEEAKKSGNTEALKEADQSISKAHGELELHNIAAAETKLSNAGLASVTIDAKSTAVEQKMSHYKDKELVKQNENGYQVTNTTGFQQELRSPDSIAATKDAVNVGVVEGQLKRGEPADLSQAQKVNPVKSGPSSLNTKGVSFGHTVNGKTQTRAPSAKSATEKENKSFDSNWANSVKKAGGMQNYKAGIVDKAMFNEVDKHLAKGGVFKIDELKAQANTAGYTSGGDLKNRDAIVAVDRAAQAIGHRLNELESRGHVKIEGGIAKVVDAAALKRTMSDKNAHAVDILNSQDKFNDSYKENISTVSEAISKGFKDGKAAFSNDRAAKSFNRDDRRANDIISSIAGVFTAAAYGAGKAGAIMAQAAAEKINASEKIGVITGKHLQEARVDAIKEHIGENPIKITAEEAMSLNKQDIKAMVQERTNEYMKDLEAAGGKMSSKDAAAIRDIVSNGLRIEATNTSVSGNETRIASTTLGEIDKNPKELDGFKGAVEAEASKLKNALNQINNYTGPMPEKTSSGKAGLSGDKTAKNESGPKQSKAESKYDKIDYDKLKNEIKELAAERNAADKSGDTETYQEASRKFMDAQAVKNGGVSRRAIENSMDNQKHPVDKEHREAFVEASMRNAERLVEAGVLKQTGDGEFNFTSNQQKEMLNASKGESYEAIAGKSQEINGGQSDRGRERSSDTADSVKYGNKGANVPNENKDGSKGTTVTIDVQKVVSSAERPGGELDLQRLEKIANGDTTPDLRTDTEKAWDLSKEAIHQDRMDRTEAIMGKAGLDSAEAKEQIYNALEKNDVIKFTDGDKVSIDKADIVREEGPREPGVGKDGDQHRINVQDKIDEHEAKARSGNEQDRIEAAGSEATSHRAMGELTNDKSEAVREALANNSEAPEKVLDKLANDKSESVRDAALANENTSYSKLDEKASEALKAGDEKTQEIIAKNEGAAASTLDKLSESESEKVQMAVAKNENTAADTLDKLGTAGDDKLRDAVEQNPNASKETIEKIGLDKDADFALKFKDEESQKVIAENDKTTPATLDKLSGSESEKIQEMVAQNEKTTPETLEKLSASESEKVQEAVAKNENASPETLEKLSKSESEEVRIAVAQNENTSKETLEGMKVDEAARKEAEKEKGDIEPKPTAEMQNAQNTTPEIESNKPIEQSAEPKPEVAQQAQEAKPAEQATETKPEGQQVEAKPEAAEQAVEPKQEGQTLEVKPEGQTAEQKADSVEPAEKTRLEQVIESRQAADAEKSQAENTPEKREITPVPDKAEQYEAIKEIASDRNAAEANGDKEAYSEKSKEFINAQAVVNNGVNKDAIEQSLEKNKILSTERKEAFVEASMQNAERLTDEGLMKQTGEGKFEFVDEKARETLNAYKDKDAATAGEAYRDGNEVKSEAAQQAIESKEESKPEAKADDLDKSKDRGELSDEAKAVKLSEKDIQAGADKRIEESGIKELGASAQKTEQMMKAETEAYKQDSKMQLINENGETKNLNVKDAENGEGIKGRHESTLNNSDIKKDGEQAIEPKVDPKPTEQAQDVKPESAPQAAEIKPEAPNTESKPVEQAQATEIKLDAPSPEAKPADQTVEVKPEAAQQASEVKPETPNAEVKPEGQAQEVKPAEQATEIKRDSSTQPEITNDGKTAEAPNTDKKPTEVESTQQVREVERINDNAMARAETEGKVADTAGKQEVKADEQSSRQPSSLDTFKQNMSDKKDIQDRAAMQNDAGSNSNNQPSLQEVSNAKTSTQEQSEPTRDAVKSNEQEGRERTKDDKDKSVDEGRSKGQDAPENKERDIERSGTRDDSDRSGRDTGTASKGR